MPLAATYVNWLPKSEGLVGPAVSEQLIARMRDRIRQLRKVQQLAHDPRMIEMIQKIIDEGEADIAKLEASPRTDG